MRLAFAAGFASGTLAGCGGEADTVKQPASIVGFAHGIDSKLYENQWVLHVDETTPPLGNIRNLQLDPEGDFRGCRPVGDGYFSFDTNDDECGGFWADGDYCGGTEDDHCVADYDPTYTYEAEEAVVAMDCLAQLVKMEYKTLEPVVNEDCARSRKDGQWVEDQARYVLWLITSNPEYDAEEPSANEPAVITGKQDVTVQEWQQAERSVRPTVTIRNGEIVDIAFE